MSRNPQQMGNTGSTAQGHHLSAGYVEKNIVSNIKRSRSESPGKKIVEGLENDLQASDHTSKEMDSKGSRSYTDGHDTRRARKSPRLSVIGKPKDHEDGDADELGNQLESKVRCGTAKTRPNSPAQIITNKTNRTNYLEHQLEVTSSCLHRKLEEIKTLRGQLAELERKLVACKDDLFRLQPVSQTSDSDILHEFDVIHQNIIKWIDTKIDCIDEMHLRVPKVPIFQTKSDKNAAEFLKHYPSAGEYYARHLIHEKLCTYIFKDGLAMFGLSYDQEKLWAAVEDSVHQLKPPRDPKMIRAWEAETLLAFSETDFLKAKREERLLYFIDVIKRELHESFPLLFKGKESFRSLCSEVIVPANQLALKMKTSTSEYEVRMFFNNGLGFVEPARKCHLDYCKFIDVATTKTLHPNSNLTCIDGDLLGDVLIQLEPSLFRKNENLPDTVLRSDTFLVKLYHPLGKRMP